MLEQIPYKLFFIKNYYKIVMNLTDRHMTKHHNGVLDSSMKVGFQMNLKDAIEDCGVQVPSSLCLWQYPELIRKNLAATTISNLNLKGKDIINISTSTEDNQTVYTLSTSFDTSDIDRPNYAAADESWGKSMNVKDVLTDLFTNILPSVRGIHFGDTVDTDGAGVETEGWNNTLFNQTGSKGGLKPTSRYIRLYLTSQPEPIYIYVGSVVADITNGYDVQNSDTTNVNLDSINKVMTINVLHITDDHINGLE